MEPIYTNVSEGIARITHNAAYQSNNGIGWSDSSSAWGNTNGEVRLHQSADRLIVNELLVDGRNVMKELDEMRDVMLLLKREVNMEEKYPELKRIKDEYTSALDKYKTFDAIKDSE
jgi:hypothetical protein